MDTVHAHLILNHIPSIGVGAAAFLLLYGLFKKSDEVVKVTLYGLVMIALVTIAVFLTGKAAEDTKDEEGEENNDEGGGKGRGRGRGGDRRQ